MKKTLVALAVTAFAASASAVTVYENEGTKVDFDGQLRLLLEKQSSKTGNAKTTDGHSNLKNNSSRFGISVKHNINENFYGIGRYETRLGADSSNSSGWGGVVTETAYVGLGGNGHQVTFGNQEVIGDEIGQAGYDKVYGVGSQNIRNAAGKSDFSILTLDSDSAVYYSYTGIEGLKLGANYNFANDRSSGEVNTGSAKSGFGLGAVYTANVAEGQAVTVATGYTHDDIKVTNSTEKNKDGVYFGLKYQASGFSVAVDGGRGVEKQGNDKTVVKYVRTGARFDVAPAAGVYGNYSYGTLKNGTYKNTAHQFMLGADYKLHKQVVTFVEGRIIKNKDNSANPVKVTDKAIGVGLRVFW